MYGPKKGTRPRAVKQQQFEYTYLFGSICPSKGISEAIVVPWVNKDIMIEHLKQISTVTEKGRHAVVVIDVAGWHTADIANELKVQQQQFDYAYLFGAVCINKGEAEAIVSPLSNMDVMREHLNLTLMLHPWENILSSSWIKRAGTKAI